MTWYAIRTKPGAQNPRREYVVESTALGSDGRPRGKGYRIVPSLNPNVSAVEKSLKDAGYDCYMPVQRKVIRDRRKAFRYTTRRFALLVGYLFVRDVSDWPTLEALPGVAGIVGCEGRPLSIPEADIAMMREAEADAEERCQRELSALREAAERMTRRKAGAKYPAGSRVLIAKGPAQDLKGTVIGTARDGRLKTLVDGLNAIGTISVPSDHVRLVA